MKKICVYCGSSPGRRPEYLAATEALAEELVRRDIGLVYGGAGIGIMGAMADAVVARGGHVTGIIPHALANREVVHSGLNELRVVGSMHERKALMEDVSDGFIALPGGLGTLEELFEILTWSQLGFHRKPCGLLNVAGYYDGLIRFLDHTVAEELVADQYRKMLLQAEDPAQLLTQMENYQAPAMDERLSKSAR
ncbi:TIGR00730 family Rossman fold protein [Microbulbifer aggregans]|uniref:LOG family protein n=1 Tax=Microbulbifer aggregans TaxID=1769779 RepID=UPI001CFC8CF4|nr:TIGR00730 family Rossman fold protein [Microbulbifer aggregans]